MPHINSGTVELLEVPRLVTQLVNLERRTARGGRDTIDHGPQGHDDVANAVAGVLVMLLGGPAFAGAGLFEYYRQEAEKVRLCSQPVAMATTPFMPGTLPLTRKSVKP